MYCANCRVRTLVRRGSFSRAPPRAKKTRCPFDAKSESISPVTDWTRIVECVPNFSAGRSADVVARLCEVIESVAGATVLDTHSDADHNRSVITCAAVPEAAVEAAVRAAALAVELIDLRTHAGAHPRVGALDVLPFVPVRGVSLADCVRLAHEAGARIARELDVPVYFYEAAALRPDRVNLEDVRRKGFEQLRAEIGHDPERALRIVLRGPVSPLEE